MAPPTIAKTFVQAVDSQDVMVHVSTAGTFHIVRRTIHGTHMCPLVRVRTGNREPVGLVGRPRVLDGPWSWIFPPLLRGFGWEYIRRHIVRGYTHDLYYDTVGTMGFAVMEDGEPVRLWNNPKRPYLAADVSVGFRGLLWWYPAASVPEKPPAMPMCALCNDTQWAIGLFASMLVPCPNCCKPAQG